MTQKSTAIRSFEQQSALDAAGTELVDASEKLLAVLLANVPTDMIGNLRRALDSRTHELSVTILMPKNRVDVWLHQANQEPRLVYAFQLLEERAT
jgi:hypothetical protein